MDSLSTLPATPLTPALSADSISAQLRSGAPGSIAKVAKDFESMFVSIVLKEMRQTLGEGGLFGNDTGDINGGLFDMFMGKHLVESGGFGVAKMVEKTLGGR